MESISILKALSLIQSLHPEKIVVYDADNISFNLVDQLGNDISHVMAEEEGDITYIGMLREGIFSYVILNEKTRYLVEK